ncbi:MAG: carbohydrate kinase [Clostridia bacterium]|nr:carbohydrate kinase [Clostridia bacterium]
MSKLYSIGELLIDFQSVGTGGLKDTKQFVKNAGGAPANVCVQAVKLGQKAVYLTKVGGDGFGDFLIEALRGEGVDTSHILRSDKYDTSLAFVSLKEDGEREFVFYRKAAADLHFTAEEFKDIEFEKGDILEFGSVALKTAEAKRAHLALIEKAKKAGATVCFDPNLRFNLWDSASELKSAVNEFLPYADVVKVGADELDFLTGGSIEAVFAGGLKILLVTDGGKGAKLYLADGREFACNGYKVKAVDTTGAGDSFFGGFIAQLMEGKTSYQEMLEFACKCGAYTTTGYGAIPAMGNKEKIERAVK